MNKYIMYNVYFLTSWAALMMTYCTLQVAGPYQVNPKVYLCSVSVREGCWYYIS